MLHAEKVTYSDSLLLIMTLMRELRSRIFLLTAIEAKFVNEHCSSNDNSSNEKDLIHYFSERCLPNGNCQWKACLLFVCQIGYLLQKQ